MNRNYSFSNQKVDQQNVLKPNYTEERIQQIMKKYERPYQKREKAFKEYTPLRCHTQNSELHYEKSQNRGFRQRTQYQEKTFTPLREVNTNVNRYDMFKDEPLKTGHTQSYLSHYEENAVKTKNDQKFTPKKYTPKRYTDTCFRQDDASQHHMYSQKTYEDENSFVSPYRQHKSPYQPFKQSFTQNHQDLTYRKDIQNTPIGERPIREDNPLYHKEKQLSINLKKRFQQVDCDGRISNIDKINDKIKKILESCSEFKVAETYNAKREKYDFSTHNIDRDCDMTPKRTRKDGRNEDKSYLKLNLNLVEGHVGHQKTKTTNIQNSRQERGVKPQRSRSCLYNEQQNHKPRRETEDRINKIQDKINSFNSKIAHHNEEKKKINLELTPTKAGSMASRLNRDHSKHSFVGEQVRTPTGSISKLSGDHGRSKHKLPEIDIVESRRSNHQQHEIIFPEHMTSKNKFNKMEIIVGEEPKEFIESQFYSAINEEPHFDHHATNESKDLIRLLSEQVRLDEEFRFSKAWFSNSEIYSEYEVLQSILSQRWREMSIEEIKEEFSVNFEEDDPFYSYRAEHYVLEDLVNNYIICNKNWKEKIQHQWSINNLKAEGLIQRLDMDGNGYIKVEDLVRVINMEEGTFYRNRDLYLVFQRMMKRSGSIEQKISTKVFLSMLSNN